MKKIQIDSILVENTSPYNFNHGEGGINNKVFAKIKLINFFIGQNNTGKSQFLRSIYQARFEGFSLNELNRGTLEHHFQEWKNIITDYYFRKDPKLTDSYSGLLKKLSANQGHIEKIEPTKNPEAIGGLLFLINHRIKNILKTEFGSRYPNVQTPELKRDTDKINFLLNELDNFIKYCDDPIAFGNKQYYIPTLRGLRRFLSRSNDIINDDIYAILTSQEYFGGLSEDNKVNKIYTGYGFYSDLKQLLLGEIEGRELVKEFQDFLSESFFDGKKITLIPREGKSKDNFKVIIKIGDVEERPIHLVGDGLQQLIIILFPIFTNKARCLFFIEEPDLFMHPGMQKALVKAMLEHDQHQYFITTHSNHIIDHDPNLYDVATFHFSKRIIPKTESQKTEEKFIVKYCSGDNYAIMQDIGVKPSSVLLSNCTIWVEGITDRLYIKAYLEKFIADLDREKNKCGFSEEEINQIKTFKEDYHYSFIEYQGSCINHWSFEKEEQDNIEVMNAIKTCAQPILIADSDAEKYKQIKKIMKDLGEKAWYFTKGKEIENMSSDVILKEWLKKDEFKDVLGGGNIENVKEDEYKTNDFGLGYYLNDLFKINFFTEKKKLQAGKKQSGKKKKLSNTTLKRKYKDDLCNFTFKFIKSPVDYGCSDFKLNPEQINLCKKIIWHVLSNNK